uniref:Uncharacterized protein n=1 Tax=Nelumbo nucifera TaxID=4432 RepID=A0A822Z6F7_NELNU|nr:TPA_asm: hypothetical protein HUJ06_013378 [Nelumbo nucifera]
MGKYQKSITKLAENRTLQTFGKSRSFYRSVYTGASKGQILGMKGTDEQMGPSTTIKRKEPLRILPTAAKPSSFELPSNGERREGASNDQSLKMKETNEQMGPSMTVEHRGPLRILPMAAKPSFELPSNGW